MKYIRFHTLIFSFLWTVVALQVLNMSVCGGDFNRYTPRAHKSSIGQINQIDSFAEYVWEDLLKITSIDAFPDKGLHNHTKTHNTYFQYQDYKLPVQFRLTPVVVTAFIDRKYPIYKSLYIYLYSKEITPPPPKSGSIC